MFAMAGCPDCHRGATPPAGLLLDTEANAFTQLVGVPAQQCASGRLRVRAGEPGASYLVNKLTGMDLCAGQRMPRGGPFLSDASIDTVRQWITDGAGR